MKPSEILRKAADLIEPEGAWCQDHLGEKEGNIIPTILNLNSRHADLSGACKLCAEGAMIVAARGEEPSLGEAFVAMRKTIPVFVHEWNDDPDRTQAEVVAKLRECADSLDVSPTTGGGVS